MPLVLVLELVLVLDFESVTRLGPSVGPTACRLLGWQATLWERGRGRVRGRFGCDYTAL